MNDASMAAVSPSEMDLLIFSAAGLTLAVDTVQVDCVMSLEQAQQQGISCLPLSTIFGLEPETFSASATVILYRNGTEACGIKVDRLDSIISMPIKTIQPIPEPLSCFAGPRLFWGVILRENKAVLIIDLYRLKDLKSYAAVSAA